MSGDGWRLGLCEDVGRFVYLIGLGVSFFKTASHIHDLVRCMFTVYICSLRSSLVKMCPRMDFVCFDFFFRYGTRG